MPERRAPEHLADEAMSQQREPETSELGGDLWPPQPRCLHLRTQLSQSSLVLRERSRQELGLTGDDTPVHERPHPIQDPLRCRVDAKLHYRLTTH